MKEDYYKTMYLSDDCIQHIMTMEPSLKFTMAMLNRAWLFRSYQLIVPIKSAIYNSDYFTLSRCPDWMSHISLSELCELGDELLVRKYIECVPVIILEDAFYKAGCGGHLKIVKLLASARNYCTETCREYMLDTVPWYHALTGAISKNQTALIADMLNSKPNFGIDIVYNWDQVLYIGYKYDNVSVVVHALHQGGYITPNMLLMAACYSGNVNIINMAIDEGAGDWQSALELACEAGNLDLLKAILDPTDTTIHSPILNPNWEDLLFCACCKDQKIIIDYIIPKVKSYDRGLEGAYSSKNLELVDYMISLGGNHTSSCLLGAYLNNDYTAVQYYLKKASPIEYMYVIVGLFFSSDFNIFKRIFEGNYETIMSIAAHNICRLRFSEYAKIIKNPNPILRSMNLAERDFNHIICSQCQKKVSDH